MGRSLHGRKIGDNGTFQWNFHGIDRAGNALEKDTGLDQISALAFSDFSASPSETFGYLADTRTPKLTSIGIVADKAEDAFDYDNDSIHVLKSGDNLTLSFTTDESVDNQSLHPDLMIGSVDRSSDVNLSETGIKTVSHGLRSTRSKMVTMGPSSGIFMGSTGQETHSRRIQDLIRSARWPSVISVHHLQRPSVILRIREPRS